MGDRSGGATALPGMDGFVVLVQDEFHGELWMLVETEQHPMGCPDCGVRATRSMSDSHSADLMPLTPRHRWVVPVGSAVSSGISPHRTRCTATAGVMQWTATAKAEVAAWDSVLDRRGGRP